MQIKKKSSLLFVSILVCGMMFIGSTSVFAQREASWKEIVESDWAIWNRRITDENIIQTIRNSSRRIAENFAAIEQIRQKTLQKLRNKDCVSSAMAIKTLTEEQKHYPHKAKILSNAIEQIRREAGKQCNL